MPETSSTNLPPGPLAGVVGLQDLQPLTWILPELRKTVAAAGKAVKRFAREHAGTTTASADASVLRSARQQLHQVAGVLELAELPVAATMARALEAAAAVLDSDPDRCTEANADIVERGGFALVDFLEDRLEPEPRSPLGMFPQYRAAQELAGAARIHPADLWPVRWQWPAHALEIPGPAEPATYGPAARSRLDRAVLQYMRAGDAPSAAALRDTCLALAGGQDEQHQQVFWQLSAAFFDALAARLLIPDPFVKRAVSRVLLEYVGLAERGSAAVSERSLLDLLFFCAQAGRAQAGAHPVLDAVRDAWLLDALPVARYDEALFGRYDPRLLAQTRRRIEAVKESWSSFVGGEQASHADSLEQLGRVADSLRKLYGADCTLATALGHVAERITPAPQAPPPALAMETATALLFLEANFSGQHAHGQGMLKRMDQLAARLEAVCAGGAAQPIEPWMEELYRSTSDSQTMGSVVGELHATLDEVEKRLDRFFRAPGDPAPLDPVPGLMSQMRGVLSVLGMEQAALALNRMRSYVEQLRQDELIVDPRRPPAIVRKLGSSLGALSFLLDTLGYQPALARELFTFDADEGEFRYVAGRVRKQPGDAPADSVAAIGAAGAQRGLRDDAPVQDRKALRKTLQEIEQVSSLGQLSAFGDSDSGLAASIAEGGDGNLRGVFLDKARLAIGDARSMLEVLARNPADIDSLTELQRIFDALKASARMLDLPQYGAAAQAFEQLLLTWIALERPADPKFQAVMDKALDALHQWADDIAAGRGEPWTAAPFERLADGLRLRGEHEDVVLEPDLSGYEALEDSSAQAPGEIGLRTANAGDGSGWEFEPDGSGFGVGVEAALDAPRGPVRADRTDPAFAPTLEVPELGEPVPGVGAHDHLSRAEPAQLPEFEFLQENPEDAGRGPQLSGDPSSVQDDAAAAAAAPALAPVAFDFPPIDLDLPQHATWETAPTDGATAGDGMARGDAVPGDADAVAGDDFVQVGEMRIYRPLYETYLGEATVWSQELQHALAQWGAGEPVPMRAVDCAHSLAGSSATVGFPALSAIARALENALRRVQDHGNAEEEQVRLANDAAAEIAGVLQDFAAGWRIEPSVVILEALQALHPPPVQDLVTGSGYGELETPGVDERAGADADADADAEFILASPMEAVPSEADAAQPLTPDAVDPEVFSFFEDEAGELLPQLTATVRAWINAPQDAQAKAQILRVLHTLKGSARLAGAFGLGDLLHYTESAVETLHTAGLTAARLAPLLERVDLIQSYHEVLRLGGTPDVRSVQPLATAPGDLIGAGTVDALSAPAADPRAADQGAEAELASDTPSGFDFNFDREPEAGAEPAADLGLDTRQLSALFPELSIEGAAAPEAAAPAAPAGADDTVQRPSFSGFFADDAAFTRELETATRDAQQVSAAQPPPSAEEGSVLPNEFGQAPEAAPAVVPSEVAPPLTLTLAAESADDRRTVRVDPHLLDHLMAQFGELVALRTRLEADTRRMRTSLVDLIGSIERLRSHMREVEVQAETQGQTAMMELERVKQGFDPLELDRYTRIQEATRLMAESVDDVVTVQRSLQRALEASEDDLARQGQKSREVQRDLLRTRMVEFDIYAERFERVVRQACRESGKQAKLEIAGRNTEVDRSVLDRLGPVFEHMLRNCVVHGIEAPAARERLGKGRVGQVGIAVQQQGNDVAIELGDDGAGLDLDAIRQRAVERGLIAPEQELSDAEAINLIFSSGFTTAKEVTRLAGRGVGLDVVQSQVQALGGRIEVDTEAGQGTVFKLVVPVTTTVTHVVMVRCGRLEIALPSGMVETIARAPQETIGQASVAGVYQHEQEELPFYWFGALLQQSVRSEAPPDVNIPVVICHSAARRVALQVDEVLGDQEVVVKPLGRQLSRLPGLVAVTVLGSGAVALVYNPVALAVVFGNQAHELMRMPVDARAVAAQLPLHPESAVAVRSEPLILVVDDSITVRRVMARLLERRGYRVALAADGLEGMDQLRKERPAVVLTDIEMPRMDGFDFVRAIRADQQLRDLPIIVITSRVAEKHRNHVLELGADHFLGKPYATEMLLHLIKACVQSRSAPHGD